MRLTTDDLRPPTLDLRFGAREAARPLLGRRLSVTTTQRLAAVAVVPLVASAAWLAASSDHLQRPLGAALYWGYLVAASMVTGLVWWRRRPDSRFGPLLVVFGVLTWLTSWQGSGWPLTFDLGVLAEAPFFALTFYLFLAFPMGRLEPPAARWLMLALVAGIVAFFLPWALFAPVIAGGGPLTTCAPGCPQNVLQIGTAPTVVDVAGHAETYAALAITVGVVVVYLRRLLRASRPQRRSLLAVAVTSLLFLPAYFAYNFSAWVLELSPGTLSTLAWGIVGTRILLPLGFLIALLQADRFAARSLGELLEQLAGRPSPAQWRETVAGVLADDDLRLGYHDPGAETFREPGGGALTPPTDGGRRWVPIERGDVPVAAMVVDESLVEDPELVRAAGFATLLAVENGALEGELRASRTRILEAGHAERRRIERDLHDGAQQRLVALRIRLELVGERLDDAEEQAMVKRLGDEVEVAIHELRDLARGVYPQLLEMAGLPAAIKAVAKHSAIPVGVVDEGLSRQPEATETTLYFCCLEAVQNAAKHAGPGASVTVRLREDDRQVEFSVADDGAGFDPAAVRSGTGLTHLTDRLAAVGGSVRIDARPGHGTRVTGTIPR